MNAILFNAQNKDWMNIYLMELNVQQFKVLRIKRFENPITGTFHMALGVEFGLLTLWHSARTIVTYKTNFKTCIF